MPQDTRTRYKHLNLNDLLYYKMNNYPQIGCENVFLHPQMLKGV